MTTTTTESAVDVKTRLIVQALNKVSDSLLLCTFFVQGELVGKRGYVTCYMRNLDDAKVLVPFIRRFIHTDARAIHSHGGNATVEIMVDEGNS